jgi:hypothetical protein
VDIRRECEALKARITVALQATPDPVERDEILVAALYELSRALLPALGRPVKSQSYQENLAAVSELISFLAIPYIRNPTGSIGGVAVLTELAEGCHDPQLKKKLLVYAQQLRSQAPSQQPAGRRPRRLGYLAGGAVLGLVTVALVLSASLYREPGHGAPQRRMEQPVAGNAAVPAAQPEASPANAAPAVALLAQPDAGAEERTEAKVEGGPQGAKFLLTPVESTTRIRVENNQILVPATLRLGNEVAKVDLIVDTGATRSTIHEAVASRLGIDLGRAKVSMAEVADGRQISSHSYSIDALTVGPFTMAAPEVDIMQYRGKQAFHDGLLGMDFLGKHRHQIDMEHELIRWF